MDRFRQTHAQMKTVVVACCFIGLSLPQPPKPPSQTDVVNLYIGTGSDWKNLPSTAQFLSTQTDTTMAMFALIYKMAVILFGTLFDIRCLLW
jgi:hypothetical protein